MASLKCPRREFPGSAVVRTPLSLLSLPRAQVQSLVRKLGSHKPGGVAKKKKKKKVPKEITTNLELYNFISSTPYIEVKP